MGTWSKFAAAAGHPGLLAPPRADLVYVEVEGAEVPLFKLVRTVVYCQTAGKGHVMAV